MKVIAKFFDELTSRELYEILKVRSQIFIVEKRMNCLDMDGVDFYSRHIFLEDEGQIVAYLRAFYGDEDKKTVKIGRVVSATHGIGLGRLVMEAGIEDIKKNLPCEMLIVNAQTDVEGFYKKLGFRTVSDVFIEADVPHVRMEMEIK